MQCFLRNPGIENPQALNYMSHLKPTALLKQSTENGEIHC